MKNIQLIQCAYDAFCHRNKKFFATYADTINLLTDEIGIIVIDTMKKNIDIDLDEKAIIDIFDLSFDSVLISEITEYRCELYVDGYIERAQASELKNKKIIIETQFRKGHIDINDAIEAMQALGEIGCADNVYETANSIIENSTNEIEWIVENYIPAGGLVVMAGSPKSGKSMLALDLAIKMATDNFTWLESLSVNSGKVVYIDAENARVLIKNRLRLLDSGQTKNLFFITRQTIGLGKIDLTNLETTSRIKKSLAKLELTENDLIVFDSFRRLFSGNENDSSEVAAAMAAIVGISPAAKLILHHLRKQGQEKVSISERIRGSGDITAAVDALITIETEGVERKTSVLKLSLARWNSGMKPININWHNCSGKLFLKELSYNEEQTKDFEGMKLIAQYLQTSFESRSIPQMANKTDLSKQTIRNALATLKREGKLLVDKIDGLNFYKVKK